MNYFISFEEYLKDYEMIREFYIYCFGICMSCVVYHELGILITF